MPIESASDRAVFVNPDEFGATAVYTPAGGVASPPIAGQFDDPSRMASLDNAVVSVDARPSFYCAAEDLPGTAVGDAGDRLAIDGGATFEVTSIEPDGRGMALLTLGATG